MLAVVKRSNEPDDIGVLEVQKPSPDPQHVIIAVSATGICGTDLHIMKGEYKVVPPVVIGHEICGIVAEVGAGVDQSWLGARVVLETFFDTCNVCRYCRGGRPNLCPNRRSIGTHVNGGMTQFVHAPARNLHCVPDKLSDYEATLAEPLACVCNALFDRGPIIAAGDAVLVIGPGPIGIIAAQVAKSCGAIVSVRGTKSDTSRLTVVESLSMRALVVEDGEIAREGFDVVIECSGNMHGFSDALTALRRGGRLVQFGIFGRAITTNLDVVCFKEIILTSGFASTPQSWLRAMSLLDSNELRPAPLISDAGPPTEWKGLFESALSQKGLKYVIDPRIMDQQPHKPSPK